MVWLALFFYGKVSYKTHTRHTQDTLARRNPWRVRITVGWEVDELAGKSKQIFKTLGYYPSRREAEAVLNEYFEDPYNIGDKDMTFQELYNSWSEKYFPTLSGVSAVRTITFAYRYMHIIYKMKVRDIRVRHLEECLKDAYIIPDIGKDKGDIDPMKTAILSLRWQRHII